LKGSIRGTFAGYISTSAGNTLFIFNWIEVSTLTRYEMTTNRYTTATVTESFETATKTLSSGIDVFTYATSGGDLLSSVINTVLNANINKKGFMLNLTGAYSGIYYCSASRDSGSIYNFTLTDLVDLKSYKVSHMDTTGITLSEFFSNYEVKQESSDGSAGSSKVNVSADDYTYMSTVKETIVSVGKAPEEPTLVQLNGYAYNNMLLIWFFSVGGDYSYVHCWDLTNGKHYLTNEPIELSTIHINDFLSSTYEVPFGSSKQQVVRVDVTDLLATQNVELFKALTELYMNGNIVIVASLDGVNVVVSYVDLISADEATWGVSIPTPTYNDEGITEVVTTTHLIRYKDGVLTYLTKESSDGSSSSGNTSSGGGASIIYATELPSTPQQAIYVVTQDEVKKVEIVQSGIILPPESGYVEVVDALPEFGTVAIDLQTEYRYGYYLTTDGILYGYIDTAFSELTGGQLPVGWMPISNLFVLFGATVGGLITSLDQATDESAVYFLLTTEPKTRVYVPMPDGTFLELTSGVRTRFDKFNRTVSLTEV
jgi:hypothetical protein